MNVMIAAGGTGGHIYPGIAVANEIMSRADSNRIRFVGTARGLESRIVPEAGFELSLIDSTALKSVGFAGKIKGLLKLPKSFFESRRLIKEFQPDVVVGAGGYVTGAVLIAAWFSRIPTLAMDSNALPGFTNRQLARFVTRAALTFDEAMPYFGNKGVVTGNPVRKEFFEIEPKEPADRVELLLFGGSQGARGINLAMIDALDHLGEYKEKLSITHQTGKYDFDTVKQGYSEKGWNDSVVTEYISDMIGQFKKTDLIVSRAGATTCAELAAGGKPAIMVPLPTAADDHQRNNAEALQNNGSAIMILQKDLSGEILAKTIIGLINDTDNLIEMAGNAKKLARKDAAVATVDLIEELAGG
ncbi:MAG: undecaprenyldiphospho-muramoylpentapeptide beta-N-acetylglucosaminyltransferase [Pyrinomonadaceae bacterium]|nr:undecaprenyldiphospho-muramoylpentapeptide beta-N-acetylglucosaminyltransferase [Pyrinomonadaceae bacterium]